jgi:hypothetical protein
MSTKFGEISAQQLQLPSAAWANKYVFSGSSGILVPQTAETFKDSLGLKSPGTQQRLEAIAGAANPSFASRLILGTDGLISFVREINPSVDVQYSSTKPTIRSNGTALQINDIWFDTALQNRAYWSGTNWFISDETIQASFNQAGTVNVNHTAPLCRLDVTATIGFYVQSVGVDVILGSASTSGSSAFQYQFQWWNNTNGTTSLGSPLNMTTLASGARYQASAVINTGITSNTARGIQCFGNRLGTTISTTSTFFWATGLRYYL